MIGFALPWLFALGTVASLGVTALHFLSVRQPPVLLLPTARFLDEGQVRAVSRSTKPTDLLLLVFRVFALLLACAALAGPRWVAPSRSMARVIVADAALRGDSSVVLRLAAADSTREEVRIVWSGASVGDSTSAVPNGIALDLAAAIPIGLRAAAMVATERPGLDSVSLHVVASSTALVSDDGWRAWRRTWPGAVHVHTFTRGDDTTSTTDGQRTAPRLTFDTTGLGAPSDATDDIRGDDPVRAAFTARGSWMTRPIVVRRANVSTASTSSDATSSAAASSSAESTADVTIVWPMDGVPRRWQAVSDTTTALAARGTALVASWPRRAVPNAEALREGRPIVWWGDGTPAALERRRGTRCVREVGVPVPGASDLLLDPAADGVMAALVAPCGREALPSLPLPALVTADSLDQSGGAAAPATYFRASGVRALHSTPGWLTPLLLGLALAFLVAEWRLRDRETVSS